MNGVCVWGVGALPAPRGSSLLLSGRRDSAWKPRVSSDGCGARRRDLIGGGVWNRMISGVREAAPRSRFCTYDGEGRGRAAGYASITQFGAGGEGCQSQASERKDGGGGGAHLACLTLTLA